MESSEAILPAKDRAELDRLRRFLQRELPGAGAVSTTSRIIIADGGRYFSGSLTRRGTRGLELCDDANTQISMRFQFTTVDAILLVIQVLDETCPTLTDLDLHLPSPQEYPHDTISHLFDTVLLQLYSALRTSRSISTLDITFSDVPEHLEAVDRCFSGNSTLRSCTLEMRPCRYYYPRHGRRHPLQKILGPFTTRVESELNVGIKEFVLKSIFQDPYAGCRVCQEAIANLVVRNVTLEKLEVGDHIFPNRGDNSARFVPGSVMARAVRCNRTLKEIRFQCTVADFKELVLALIPDADGHQANTSLSTLKLSLIKGGSLLDCMIDLAKLVESNHTLKHVQLFQESCNTRFWDSGKRNEDAKGLELSVRDELERMLNNGLRRNARLQSLSAGSWELVRVDDGHEWQIKDNSCLVPGKEYVVKVSMR